MNVFKQDVFYLNCHVVEPFSPDIKANVLCNGHLDKHPYKDQWLTYPTEPVINGDIIYGRGEHDDGYALFTSCWPLRRGYSRMIRCHKFEWFLK